MKIDLRGLRKSESDPKECSIPDDYVEIVPKYIKVFKGTWIKYTDKPSGKSYPGGFLIDIDEGKAFLRNIKQQVAQVRINTSLFYCNRELEVYKAVQELIMEWEKLDIERIKLNAEKNKLIDDKRKFYQTSESSSKHRN
jgi:hypothetical protein